MKEITNNTKLGNLTLILNAVVLVLFIVSMVFLMKFDKTNNVVVNERATYESLYEEYTLAQHPLRQDSAEVAYYTHKLDTLKLKNPSSKDEKKALADNIENTKTTLAEKIKIQKEHIAVLGELKPAYEKELAIWNEMGQANEKAKSLFWSVALVTLLAFLAKIVILALYGYRNSVNLHKNSPWMKDGMKPSMSFISWFIPIYNLIKPLSFIREVWDETDYLLKRQGIVKDEEEVDNSGLHFGIWWSLTLISCWLMNAILFFTFFREGAFFHKVNHGAIVIVAIIFIVLTIVEEAFLIRSYNKKNELLCKNVD